MNNPKEIRWKQRFQNYDKAFKQLQKAVDLEQYSDIERAGLIQIFSPLSCHGKR